jgi:hypothetical protein
MQTIDKTEPVYLCFSMNSDSQCAILNWNVRGLNNPARRQVVRDLVTEHKCSIVCLQETKIQRLTDAIVAETLGQKFSKRDPGRYSIGLFSG